MEQQKEHQDQEHQEQEHQDQEHQDQEHHDQEHQEQEQEQPLTQAVKELFGNFCVTRQQKIQELLTEKKLSFEDLEKIYYETMYNGLTANDFYKIVMGPVLWQFKFLNTFTADIRDVLSQEEIQKEDSTVIRKLIAALEQLKHRRITKEQVLHCAAANPKLVEFYSRVGDQLFEHLLVSEIIVGRKPNEDDDKILEKEMKSFVYVYYGFNAKTKRNEWIIQSRGMCAKNSWVETPLMQIIYQTFLEHYCEQNNITKEQYIAKCIVSEIITIMEQNEKTTCRYALFAGRRSCFLQFLILQNYILFKLMDPEKIIGSSSMWAIMSLREMGFDIPYPWVGTIAHEMFMMAQAAFEDYDNNEENVSYSQAIVLYMYMVLVHKEGTPFPCLPDTLGSRTCFRALQAVMISVTNEDGTTTEKSLLEYVGMIRKDSGEMQDFQQLCRQYPELSNAKTMDSEIKDLNNAISSNQAGIMTIGAGGLFGETKIPDEFLTEEERILLGLNPDLKMAVKVTEVKKTATKSFYPVKTGDDKKAGKLSIHPTIDEETFATTMKRVKRFQDANDKPAKKRRISHRVVSGKMIINLD
jgi:nicotinic acid phosphoribosyltransferase